MGTKLYFDDKVIREVSTLDLSFEVVTDTIEDYNSDIPLDVTGTITKASGSFQVQDKNLKDFYEKVSYIDSVTGQRMFKPVHVILVTTNKDGTILKSDILYNCIVKPKDVEKPQSKVLFRKYNFDIEGHGFLDYFDKLVKVDVFTGSDLVSGELTLKDTVEEVLLVTLDGKKIFKEEFTVDKVNKKIQLNTDITISSTTEIKVVYATNHTSI